MNIRYFIVLMLFLSFNLFANDFDNITVEVTDVEYYDLFNRDGVCIRYKINTTGFEIYKDTKCILKKDYIGKENMLLANDIFIYYNISSCNFEIYKIKTNEIIEINFKSEKYISTLSPSIYENIFYAIGDRGNIYKINVSDKTITIIDGYKMKGIFIGLLNNGNIFTIGTDYPYTENYKENIEIRIFDNNEHVILKSAIKLSTTNHSMDDFYYCDNRLFIYKRYGDEISNIITFRQNMFETRDITNFGRVINSFTINGNIYYCVYKNIYGGNNKIFIYDSSLKMIKYYGVSLTDYYDINYIRLIGNRIVAYECSPGK